MKSVCELNDEIELRRLEEEVKKKSLAAEAERKKFIPYELLLIRHGESDGNAAGLCQGYSPGYLTPKGRVQAAAVGASLFLNPDGTLAPTCYQDIFCSDLRRVQETCNIALVEGKQLQGVIAKVQYSSLLREKNAGIFEGRQRRFMVEARSKAENERVFRPRNGESWEDLQARVREFVQLVHGAHRDRADLPWRVLVFTSGKTASYCHCPNSTMLVW